MIHTPVLLEEVIEYLEPLPGKKYIDATANGGGHTSVLAQAGAEVLAIEWDEQLARALSLKLKAVGSQVPVIHDSYVNIVAIAKEHGFENCDGVLFDLGFSTWQIEEAGRGFSFEQDEPLDMRYDAADSQQPEATSETAADIVNRWSEQELADIFKEYGEERFDGRIAHAIVQARRRSPITRTLQLVEIVREAVPFAYRRGKIHFATRVFQALRIAVNQELENVQKGIEAAMEVLKPGGRIAVIAFHSLEDRIVKQYFREQRKAGTLTILTKKPIRAAFQETVANRKSRSAKLRVAEKL